MQKIVLISFLFLMVSCNDGDLQIETIDFDNSALQYCGPATTITTVFFKINQDETLILDLQSGILKNQVSDSVIVSTVPDQSQITYRIFSDNVTTNYFCDAIPPITPVVLQEINGEGGEVQITTTTKDSITYDHMIKLSGISLVDDSGHRITDLRINDFGTYSTKVPGS
ncbi:hypothetical protein K8352_14415 [Flavobacteriaceae bacterium F89]|uniref:Uncharacterized protein n=1 Tax=Cerina litoralis TaxID=2874477 RepID=A0AAE3EWU2_9FLAO|nr:hypothetical protein [Cerina litoralis]MCG2461950.1 hypothetical protein [Cerina litoralis]